jgi:hypothetical protein
LTVTIVSSIVTNVSSKAPLPDFEHRSSADIAWRMKAHRRKPAGAQTESAEIDQQGINDNRSLKSRWETGKQPLWAALPSSERDCRLGGKLAARLTSKRTGDRRVPVYALRVSRDIVERADGATD